MRVQWWIVKELAMVAAGIAALAIVGMAVVPFVAAAGSSDVSPAVASTDAIDVAEEIQRRTLADEVFWTSIQGEIEARLRSHDLDSVSIFRTSVAAYAAHCAEEFAREGGWPEITREAALKFDTKRDISEHFRSLMFGHNKGVLGQAARAIAVQEFETRLKKCLADACKAVIPGK